MPILQTDIESAGVRQLRRIGLVLVLSAQFAVFAGLATRAALVDGNTIGILPVLLIFLASFMLVHTSKSHESTRVLLSIALILDLLLIESIVSWVNIRFDGHTFFAVLLTLVGFMFSWRAILATFAVIAAHHLGMMLLASEAAFPDVSDLPSMLGHLAALGVQALVLMLLVGRLGGLLRASENSARVAREALSDAGDASMVVKVTSERDSNKADPQRSVGAFTGTIGETLAAVAHAATGMHDAATKLQQIFESSNSGVANAVESARAAADHVGAAAGAASELSRSIAEVAGQLHSTSEAVSSVRKAGEVSLQRMNELTLASEKIGDVINLIHAIAGHTNLLALNASIEAVRAGEAGRGFALVASEVKSLAAQTGKATDEIAEQIKTVQRATSESAGAIKAMAGGMIDIDQFVASIAAAVEQQESTTRAMLNTIASAASNSRQSSDQIVTIRSQALEMGEVAGAVLSCAKQVLGATDSVRSEVAGFAGRASAA